MLLPLPNFLPRNWFRYRLKQMAQFRHHGPLRPGHLTDTDYFTGFHHQARPLTQLIFLHHPQVELLLLLMRKPLVTKLLLLPIPTRVLLQEIQIL